MSPTEPRAWTSPALPVGPRVPVWAPAAKRVELHLPGDDRLVDMVPAPDGWWTAPFDLEPGTDYAFRVDGSPDRPDPRSALQPDSVHGPSRTVDPTAWQWTDQDWTGKDLLGSVIYELHVGTFTPEGTLDGAISRLGHLAELGVDIVELMPLAAFPGRAGWGYDGVGLWAVHEAYGGPDALMRFVDAAHHAGIGVCLDVVYNHLGPSGNYLSVFGPYFTPAHHTPWGEAVNYDHDGSQQVRAFVIDSALRWLRDFHIDALRLDAIHEIKDDAEAADPPQTHVLAELSDAVTALSAELGRPLSLVAEADLNDVGVITPTDQEPPATAPSLGMTAQWADDVHHACTHGSPGRIRATTETSPSPARGPRPTAEPSSTTAPGPPSAAGSGAPRARGHRPQALRRLRLQPRPGRQPSRRRPSLSRPRRCRPGRHCRPGAPVPLHSHALHGRGVGDPHPPSSSSPTTRRRTWPAASVRGASGSSPASAGTPTIFPIPRPPEPSRPHAWTGRSLRRPITPACWPGTGH